MMPTAHIEVYLSSARKQFEYYKALGDKTIAQIPEESMLFYKPNDESNSIAILVHHLWGNMLSRWTDFLTSDGEKPWRNRDMEFEDVIQSKDELLEKWEAGWKCLFDAIDSVHVDNFDTQILIRNQAHTITDAINRQLCHYAYHVGQIVYIGKIVLNQNWQSLSIPRGGSKSFNQEKFARGIHLGHFTDDLK